ncbi:glyoxalase/bleomycin resistance/extradiol dioxygenase family protein [Ensifer sp. D2-11]
MRFVNPIPFVRDIQRSKAFYRDVIALKVLEDFGSFVLFETGFSIHEGTAIEKTVWGKAFDTNEPYGCGNLLLYFEHEDVGQRVFRFYDPDRHVIEVGEPQSAAVSESTRDS